MGKSLRQHITCKTLVISPGQTLTVDSFDYNSWRGHVEYTFTAISNTIFKTLKIQSSKVDLGVRDVVYGIVGLGDIDIDPIYNSPNFNLVITNNEAESLTITMTRVKP